MSDGDAEEAGEDEDGEGEDDDERGVADDAVAPPVGWDILMMSAVCLLSAICLLLLTCCARPAARGRGPGRPT